MTSSLAILWCFHSQRATGLSCSCFRTASVYKVLNLLQASPVMACVLTLQIVTNKLPAC